MKDIVFVFVMILAMSAMYGMGYIAGNSNEECSKKINCVCEVENKMSYKSYCELNDKIKILENEVVKLTHKGEGLCQQNGAVMMENHEMKKALKRIYQSGSIKEIKQIAGEFVNGQ